jgi:mono/diheme cytochrome c family protein
VLFAVTKEGLEKHAPLGYASDMPAFGGMLSDKQIWAVLAYIESTWPPEIRARQAAMTQRAAN